MTIAFEQEIKERVKLDLMRELLRTRDERDAFRAMAVEVQHNAERQLRRAIRSEYRSGLRRKAKIHTWLFRVAIAVAVVATAVAVWEGLR
jgi:hypothetical protein